MSRTMLASMLALLNSRGWGLTLHDEPRPEPGPPLVRSA